MSDVDLSESINHMAHLATEPAGHDIVVPIAAVVIATLSFLWSMLAHKRERRAQLTHHALARWDELLAAYNEKPHLLGPTPRSVREHDRESYQLLCYRAWSLADFIIGGRLHREMQFRAIVYWISVHGRDWLSENPFMFSAREFWMVIDGIGNEPLTLYRSEPLPVTEAQAAPQLDRYDEEVNWDLVAGKYDDFLISPFAPQMVTPDPLADWVRNRLLAYLDRSFRPEDLSQMRIADYGCGPGNLLPHLAGKVATITGVDRSGTALRLAKDRADRLGINLETVEADIIDYVPQQHFDIIISVNSILPPRRDQVVPMLSSICRGLAPAGLFLAILPSFDTTERLLEYWRDHYARLSDDQNYLDKCILAFRAKKKFDPVNKIFADDNVHPQCFHTPETIRREFAQAGLEVVGQLEKVSYPWEIARKFDYGYFPGNEEIWDWFVVGRRSAGQASPQRTAGDLLEPGRSWIGFDQPSS